MTTLRRFLSAEITALGDDEVEIRMSTGAIARDGHILIPGGCVLDNYQRNPIQLWQHDPLCPVGRNSEIRIDGDSIVARTTFAPAGVSAKADEVRGLVKSGVVGGLSVGFEVLECEPLDPKKPRGGQRITKWELLECSFVSIPADTGAVVTARAVAEEQPLATGRAAPRTIVPHTIRGMYEVGRLAWLMESLSGAQHSAEIESALEGDASTVPAMLAGVLHDLGDALIAMTIEEVGEIVGGDDTDVEPAGLGDDDTVIILASSTPALKRFRAGYCEVRAALTREGRKLSAETVRCLRSALDAHDEAMTSHRAAMRSHSRAATEIRGLIDGADPEDDTEDGNSDEVQTSDGTDGADSGRNADADYRRRQADLLALSQAA